jgi:hypothetical protein
MTDEQFKTEMAEAERGVRSSYDPRAEVYFKRDAEKYCTMDSSDPFKPCILHFDVDKLRKDKFCHIPKHITEISVNCGHGASGLREYIYQGCLWGVDIFTKLLKEQIELQTKKK